MGINVLNYIRYVHTRIVSYLSDPLHKNSIFLIGSSLSNAISGFLFWAFSARLYSNSSVGVATTLVSILSIFVLLSRFGVNQSITRYFPEGNKSDIFTTSLLVTTVPAILLGALFIPLHKYVGISAPVGKFGFLFIVFLAADSIEGITGRCFIAYRRSKYYFIQNILLASRLILLPAFSLVGGAMGIFLSFGASFLVSITVSIYALSRLGVKLSNFDSSFLKESLRYSSGNYIVSLFIASPKHIAPLLVINILGPQDTAYYYIAHRIASFLFTVPVSFSTSLFVEGSHDVDLRKNTIKTLVSVFTIIIFGVIGIVFLGQPVLRLIGENYVNGYTLMIVLACSSFFVSIFRIYMSIKRVQEDISDLIVASILLSIVIISLTYYLPQELGMVGVGYAWLAGYGSVCFIILGNSVRKYGKGILRIIGLSRFC